MGSWPRYAFALGIGIILSAVFVYTGGAITIARLATSEISQTRKELTYVKKEANPLVNSYRPDERLNGLVRALRKGDLQSLQLLRPEFLSAYGEEELRGKVIPTLRSVALEALLSRMTEEDRSEWQQRALNPMTPSAARQYVDDVAVVNESLGTFLEMTGELLQLLHRTTKNGRPFSASLEAVPGQIKLTDQQHRVYSIPLFRDVFERERAREVRQYMTIRPADVKGNLSLLATVDPSYAYAEFYQALEGFLTVLAQRVTPALRLAALTDASTQAMLKPYQEQNQSIRDSAARLYNLAALDAISLGELEGAANLLRTSEAIRPGFHEQQSARELLERAREKRTRVVDAEKAAVASTAATESEDALDLDLPTANAGDAGDGLEVAPLFLILLAVGAIFAMVVAVLIWRKLRIRHLEALAAHRLNAHLNNQLAGQLNPAAAPVFKKVEN